MAQGFVACPLVGDSVDPYAPFDPFAIPSRATPPQGLRRRKICSSISRRNTRRSPKCPSAGLSCKFFAALGTLCVRDCFRTEIQPRDLLLGTQEPHHTKKNETEKGQRLHWRGIMCPVPSCSAVASSIGSSAAKRTSIVECFLASFLLDPCANPPPLPPPFRTFGLRPQHHRRKGVERGGMEGFGRGKEVPFHACAPWKSAGRGEWGA